MIPVNCLGGLTSNRLWKSYILCLSTVIILELKCDVDMEKMWEKCEEKYNDVFRQPNIRIYKIKKKNWADLKYGISMSALKNRFFIYSF